MESDLFFPVIVPGEVKGKHSTVLSQLHSLENAVLVICSLYWNYNSIINNHLDLNLVGAEIIIAEVGTSILAVS